MAPASRRLKRESTAPHGLMTPDESLYSAGSVTPKREMQSVSDVEDPFQGIAQQDGLPIIDEGYQSMVVEQQGRSESHRKSQAPPFSTSSSTMTPANNGLVLVGRDTKKLIDTIDQLRKIGLKSVDTKLPELVLVGDQSAGKSSLMGAIAEINLPKGSGICTRCPTNIKTSHADSWGCIVSLQLTHSFKPEKRKPAGQEFQNWPERDDVSTIPFKTIHNKSDLEEVLKWAQIALLNPSEDIESFIPGSIKHTHRLQQGVQAHETNFSPNIIAVEISGPGLPDLSFFDLPGLFNAKRNDDEEGLVLAFDTMTSHYIKHENALLICAINMSADPGLSKTKAEISKLKADKRCIGVLTMPDRLQSDTPHPDYDKILKGLSFYLPHGYFVTKQPAPGTKLHGSTYHVDARREEEEFFNTEKFWAPGGVWSQFRDDRCGTGTIQKYLSKQFAALIMSSIPDITEKIHAQLAQVEDELSYLPEVPKDKVQHIVRQHLTKFSQAAEQSLDRSYASHHHSFHGDWKRLCVQFQKAIEFMRPGCVLKTPTTEKVVINIDVSDDDEASQRSFSVTPKRAFEGVNESPFSVKRHKRNVITTPTRPAGQRFKHEGDMSGSRSIPRSFGFNKIKPSEYGPFYNDYLDAGWRALSLVDIRKEISSQGLAGVPEYVNLKVRQSFALTAIHPWKEPLGTFMEHTFKLLRSVLLFTLHDVLCSYEHTALYRNAKEILEEFLTQQEAEQRAITMQFYTTEVGDLFTVNEDDFLRHKAEALEVLSKQRRELRVKAYVEKNFHRKGKQGEEDALEKFKEKVTDEQLDPETYGRELEVAAYIRGYYTTARLRFIDSVCANFNAGYLRKIKQDLSYLLENKLGLDHGDSEAICQQLLEGNAEIAKKRAALQKKRNQLIEFSRVLDQLTNGSEDNVNQGSHIIIGDE